MASRKLSEIDIKSIELESVRESKNGFVKFTSPTIMKGRFKMTLPKLRAPFGLNKYDEKRSISLEVTPEVEKFFEGVDQHLIQLAFDRRSELFGKIADGWSKAVVESKYTSSLKFDKERRYAPKIKVVIPDEVEMEENVKEIECVVDPVVWISNRGFGLKMKLVFINYISCEAKANMPKGKCYL